MSKADNEKEVLKLNKLHESEKEELIKLRQENEFLRASLAYEKKLKTLIQERAKNKEKAKVIIELRQKLPKIRLKTWLEISNLFKSSFYEWLQKLNKIDKEELELINMIKNIFEESNKTYGYRRVTTVLKKVGIKIN